MSIKIGSSASPSQTRLNILNAESERHAELAKMQAQGDLRRLGITWPTNNRLNVYELDAVLKKSGMQPRERIELKARLASLQLID